MAKFYYNGVLLPEIPSDVLAEYPYCLILLVADGIKFRLMFGTETWYVNQERIYIKPSTYVIYQTTLESDSWVYETTYTDEGNYSVANGIKWSNHDIPNGSSTSVYIYLKGTDPVPEDCDYYQIKSSTLTSFADQARRLNGGTTDLLTPSQMLEIFESTEVGGSSGGSIFETKAQGTYPFIHKASAVSTMLENGSMFTTSSVGIIS